MAHIKRRRRFVMPDRPAVPARFVYERRTDERLVADLAGILPCYLQDREGWYKQSCFERDYSSRKACWNCRVLIRVKKRLHAEVRDA